MDFAGSKTNQTKLIHIPKDIVFIILDFLLEPEYKLIDWFKPIHFDYAYLSSNLSDGAVKYLKQISEVHPNMLCWWRMSGNTNPKILQIVKSKLKYKNDSLVDWELLAENKSDYAISIINSNLDSID